MRARIHNTRRWTTSAQQSATCGFRCAAAMRRASTATPHERTRVGRAPMAAIVRSARRRTNKAAVARRRARRGTRAAPRPHKPAVAALDGTPVVVNGAAADEASVAVVAVVDDAASGACTLEPASTGRSPNRHTHARAFGRARTLSIACGAQQRKQPKHAVLRAAARNQLARRRARARVCVAARRRHLPIRFARRLSHETVKTNASKRAYTHTKSNRLNIASSRERKQLSDAFTRDRASAAHQTPAARRAA